MTPEDWQKIFDDDDLGLLPTNTKKSISSSEDERLISGFQEINEFVKQNGRLPSLNKNDRKEFSLNRRLEALKEHSGKIQKLKKFDTFGLLIQSKAISTFEDIFDDDNLGLLEEGLDSIFNLRHISNKMTLPDYIAQRKPCKDFVEFEHLFRECQSDLSSGKRLLLPFKLEQQINRNDFYVLRGVLTYVANIGKKENINGKTNARLRCIFENGTESDMLLRSLARALYKDGRRITEHSDRLLDAFSCPPSADCNESGYIYILKSLSSKTEIHSINHLYKIGYSRTPIRERIKNALNEPTYLMAPVFEVASYKCFDLNPQKFEQLLHTFFANVCLSIDIFDNNGQRHSPREWFVVPLPVINEAIDLLVSKEIIYYRYDSYIQKIVERE